MQWSQGRFRCLLAATCYCVLVSGVSEDHGANGFRDGIQSEGDAMFQSTVRAVLDADDESSRDLAEAARRVRVRL